MNYEEARVYLEEASKYGSVLGLESMKGLLDKLGNPQDQLKFIHIAGTNGKGSVLAYLSTILQKAGYRIGRYISPTLFSYRERIQVDGQRIEKESLARHITVIAQAVEEIKQRQEPIPTVFEIETALAFLYFQEKKCDIAVVETGLGGALDATNVIKTTILEVIAPIGMDHMDVLGKTLGEIAQQKAGIIKKDTRVVTAAQEPEARKVLERKCREENALLRQVEPQYLSNIHYGWEKQSFSYKQWENVQISLAGKFQIQNAALALEAVEQLRETGFSLPDSAVYGGMRETVWRGRFTVISRNPVVILDGAHNPQAARALKNSLDQYFSHKKLYYVFGVFQDKDYKKIIELTAPAAEHIITVETPNNPRALPAEVLREEVRKFNSSVESADSVETAVERSLNMMSPDDVLVIFGSLSFLSLADKAIKKGEKLHG